jgi:hypothetical protein
MLSVLKYLPLPAIVAALAAVLMIACALEGNNYLVSWVSFHTWALYFLAGCNIPQGFKAGLNYMLGALAGPVIIYLIPYATSVTQGNGDMGLALACAFVTFFVICLEKCKFTNFVPASFCGASAFFALWSSTAPYAGAGAAASQSQVLLRLAIGFVAGAFLGWLTVALQGFYKTLVPQDKAA